MDNEKRKTKSREDSRKWRAANREKSRENARRWRAGHPETARATSRKSHERYKHVYKERYHVRQLAQQRAKRALMTREEKRDRDLRKKYGITLAYYNAMWAAQAGACPICALPLEGRSPGVDHAHDTGAVRAILCSRCNHAVGSLHESPAAAERLADYLRKHGRK